MFKKISLLYTNSVQETIRDIANHILVIIAFFLPISQGAVKSGFFILIALFLLQKNPLELLKNALSNRVIQAIVLLWLLHIIGIIYAENQAIAAHYAGEMKFFLYPILVIVFAQYRFIYRIFSAFILGVFLSELLSYSFFFELLTSPVPTELGGFAMAGKYEPSPFTHHIEYGYILALTSAFLLIRLLTSLEKIEKIYLGIFFITITLNVFLNSARTGYILYFITNFFVLLVYYQKLIFKKLIFILPLLLALITVSWYSSENLQREFYGTIQSIRMLTSENNLNSSIGIRYDMITTGIKTTLELHPFIGFGTGMYGQALYNKALSQHDIILINHLPDKNFYTGFKPGLDCSYLEIFVEFGIIGFLIFLTLFIQIARFKQKDPILNAIKVSLLGSSIFYAFVYQLMFGVLVPTLFITLITFTLVQRNTLQLALSPITKKTMALYTISTISLFTLSKLT